MTPHWPPVGVPDPKLAVYSELSSLAHVLLLDTKEPGPLRDRRVRQALNMAIDRVATATLQRGIWRVERRGKGLNYGSDRVRYTAAVPVGSRVRLHQTLKAAERVGQGTRMTTRCEFELEGSDRPAVVAEFILLLQDA